MVLSRTPLTRPARCCRKYKTDFTSDFCRVLRIPQVRQQYKYAADPVGETCLRTRRKPMLKNARTARALRYCIMFPIHCAVANLFSVSWRTGDNSELFDIITWKPRPELKTHEEYFPTQGARRLKNSKDGMCTTHMCAIARTARARLTSAMGPASPLPPPPLPPFPF